MALAHRESSERNTSLQGRPPVLSDINLLGGRHTELPSYSFRKEPFYAIHQPSGTVAAFFDSPSARRYRTAQRRNLDIIQDVVRVDPPRVRGLRCRRGTVLSLRPDSPGRNRVERNPDALPAFPHRWAGRRTRCTATSSVAVGRLTTPRYLLSSETFGGQQL